MVIDGDLASGFFCWWEKNRSCSVDFLGDGKSSINGPLMLNNQMLIIT